MTAPECFNPNVVFETTLEELAADGATDLSKGPRVVTELSAPNANNYSMCGSIQTSSYTFASYGRVTLI